MTNVRGWAAIAVIVVVLGACSSGTDGSATSETVGADDRETLFDEVDGVRAMVADCFVSEGGSDGRRYRTTVEVDNKSETARTVTVIIVADLGRGGASDAFEVPAGASDAWAVAGDEETADPVGDVECGDYISGVEVTLER